MLQSNPKSNFDEKISVIMPAYNCDKYIVDAVNSVLNQTYCNIELLIVDDKSQDDTLNLVNQLANRDERVQVFENPINKGVSYTRNYAIQKATGKWLAFIDSDDVWRVDKLEKQIQVILSNNSEFVFSGCQFIDEFGDSIKSEFRVPKVVDYSTMLKQNYIPCSSVLVSKSLNLEFNETIPMIHEDYLLWLKLLEKCRSAHSVQEPLLFYRMLRNSRSSRRYLTIIKNFNMFRSLKFGYFKSFTYSLLNALRSTLKYLKIKVLFGK